LAGLGGLQPLLILPTVFPQLSVQEAVLHKKSNMAHTCPH